MEAESVFLRQELDVNQKNQDRPKVTKIVSLELNNEEKILSSKNLKLGPSSCTKGLYFIESYKLLGYTSRLQIRSIKPVVRPLIISKTRIQVENKNLAD